MLGSDSGGQKTRDESPGNAWEGGPSQGRSLQVSGENGCCVLVWSGKTSWGRWALSQPVSRDLQGREPGLTDCLGLAGASFGESYVSGKADRRAWS